MRRCRRRRFTPLSKRGAGSLVRSVKASFLPDSDPDQVHKRDWDGAVGTGGRSHMVCSRRRWQFIWKGAQLHRFGSTSRGDGQRMEATILDSRLCRRIAPWALCTSAWHGMTPPPPLPSPPAVPPSRHGGGGCQRGRERGRAAGAPCVPLLSPRARGGVATIRVHLRTCRQRRDDADAAGERLARRCR